MYINLIVYLLGGIGLFILGMILMTDGLKTLAGDTLRKALSRFTGGRLRSILTGIGITALMQSSHATIITTIGFVSAGLLTFNQSVGIVIGAHIGTTSTGWLVSLIGLKFKISLFVLPLLGIGAMMRLLGKERSSHIGLVLAGFSLIFLGIDTMQTGMKDVAGAIDLSSYTAVTLSGRLLLVGVGLVMTVLMQSSSAALTITLAALSAGTLTFEQSAALVVGQNIGTTLTAAIAAVGASTPAKRTAAAHIIFNMATAAAVFFILPFFTGILSSSFGTVGVTDPTILVPAFHTAFNVLGMFIALPFMNLFSRFIIMLVPERGPALTRNIDFSVMSIPAIAIETARRTARDITMALINAVVIEIREGFNTKREQNLASIDEAMSQTRLFLSGIRSKQGSTSNERARHVSVLHVIDHIENLSQYCREADNVHILIEDEALHFLALELCEKFDTITKRLADPGEIDPFRYAEETSIMMTDVRKKEREMILHQIALGTTSPDDAYKKIEALRFLDRVAYRVWRAAFHLGEHTQ